MLFHAKAVEVYSSACRTLGSYDPEQDLQVGRPAQPGGGGVRGPWLPCTAKACSGGGGSVPGRPCPLCPTLGAQGDSEVGGTSCPMPSVLWRGQHLGLDQDARQREHAAPSWCWDRHSGVTLGGGSGAQGPSMDRDSPRL